MSQDKINPATGYVHDDSQVEPAPVVEETHEDQPEEKAE